MASDDTNIIGGMSHIINTDNIKTGIDIVELERQMISGGLLEAKNKEPQDKFSEELRLSAKKLGISFGDDSDEKSSSGRSRMDNDDDQSHNIVNNNYDNAYSKDSEDSDDSSDDSGDDNNSLLSYQHDSEQDRFSSRDEYLDFGNDLDTRTREQERRRHIETVMGNATEENSFSFENEKREDMKCAKLAEIDTLMTSLAEDDVDLSRIPTVDRHTPYEEIESVLKILRHKNDSARYCSFAEEFLLFGAHGLEELFNGSRTWFGQYQPDLTGWHNHVQVKLRRMRGDTSQLVSTVMHDYNIGPGARIALELIPSMVLYSKMRKEQHSQPGLFTDSDMSSASKSLRDL